MVVSLKKKEFDVSLISFVYGNIYRNLFMGISKLSNLFKSKS